MKKMLILLALPGSMSNGRLHAEAYRWKGLSHAPETQHMTDAGISYKHNSMGTKPGDTPCYNMCWVASASNVIAWWQDQGEENCALIIPENTREDEKERTLL